MIVRKFWSWLLMKGSQREHERKAREIWERLLKQGHNGADVVQSAELFYRHRDQAEMVPTVAEFLIAFERECADPYRPTVMQ
jgi:hypothetical protein